MRSHGGRDESWKYGGDPIGYVLRQAKEGDLVFFLVSVVTEVMYFGDKSFIMRHSAILMFESEGDCQVACL